MAHFIFILLHIAAVLFGFVFLIVTIPAHLIYSAIAGRTTASGAPTPETHVLCPDCKELVRKEARVCKHCGCSLVPASEAVMTDELAERIANRNHKA